MDDYMRLEHERDHRESLRHPRGNRLTQQPMQANNLGRDYRPLPGLPPINPPPIRNTAKDLEEMNEPPYERGDWFRDNH